MANISKTILEKKKKEERTIFIEIKIFFQNFSSMKIE